jgi:hypothetical protein
MKNLVLIVFVLGIARSQVCFFTQNCITSESRINVTRPNDALECLADCKKQNGCKWWTYDPDPDWCALMKDCHQPPDYQCRACTSGEVTCEQYRCGITGLCLVFTMIHVVPNCRYNNFNSGRGVGTFCNTLQGFLYPKVQV